VDTGTIGPKTKREEETIKKYYSANQKVALDT
jgi:hypothetical protein